LIYLFLYTIKKHQNIFKHTAFETFLSLNEVGGVCDVKNGNRMGKKETRWAISEFVYFIDFLRAVVYDALAYINVEKISESDNLNLPLY